MNNNYNNIFYLSAVHRHIYKAHAGRNDCAKLVEQSTTLSKQINVMLIRTSWPYLRHSEALYASAGEYVAPNVQILHFLLATRENKYLYQWRSHSHEKCDFKETLEIKNLSFWASVREVKTWNIFWKFSNFNCLNVITIIIPDSRICRNKFCNKFAINFLSKISIEM